MYLVCFGHYGSDFKSLTLMLLFHLSDADLAYQLTDAVRATIMDCNDGHCKLVDAWKDPLTGWHFEDRPDAFRNQAMGSSSRVLMMEFDETE